MWYLLKVDALVAGVVFAGAAMIILVLLAWPKEKPSEGGSAAGPGKMTFTTASELLPANYCQQGLPLRARWKRTECGKALRLKVKHVDQIHYVSWEIGAHCFLNRTRRR